jgi:hypothetical protein
MLVFFFFFLNFFYYFFLVTVPALGGQLQLLATADKTRAPGVGVFSLYFFLFDLVFFLIRPGPVSGGPGTFYFISNFFFIIFFFDAGKA